jgi:hypothetical protein
VSLNELQNQITKKLEVVKGGNLAPEGQKQYKYTDVVPKAGHKGDNLSPATPFHLLVYHHLLSNFQDEVYYYY